MLIFSDFLSKTETYTTEHAVSRFKLECLTSMQYYIYNLNNIYMILLPHHIPRAATPAMAVMAVMAIDEKTMAVFTGMIVTTRWLGGDQNVWKK